LRKTRGPTQESVVTPPKGEKWKCLLIDRQPVGKAASKLAIVLGLYASLDGYFPPYKEWKEQSPHSFNDVMKDIMRDYDFVDDEGLPANVNIFWERGNKVSEAERNKRNRGEDRPTHTLGAKSIARHNQDENSRWKGCNQETTFAISLGHPMYTPLGNSVIW
ncbi:hypothetical protein Taro_009360, partial [Colocasia esculenta]|nr:hypothetical protein [Colocasia esculenta]